VDNIRDWKAETNQLKFYLLDNVKKNDVNGNVDIITLTDNQSTSLEIGAWEQGASPFYADKFTDYIPLYQVNNIPHWPAIDITYNFDANELNTLAAYLGTANTWGRKTYDSTFGLGFDPDCHFYNDGVTLTIETATKPIPEPGTMLLFGSGLAGLAGVARRRRLKA